jgi:hypothetical protein
MTLPTLRWSTATLCSCGVVFGALSRLVFTCSTAVRAAQFIVVDIVVCCYPPRFFLNSLQAVRPSRSAISTQTLKRASRWRVWFTDVLVALVFVSSVDLALLELWAFVDAHLFVGAGTDPIIRRNRIHHGDQYGMFITDKAAGIIENNYFYANTW